MLGLGTVNQNLQRNNEVLKISSGGRWRGDHGEGSVNFAQAGLTVSLIDMERYPEKRPWAGSKIISSSLEEFQLLGDDPSTIGPECNFSQKDLRKSIEDCDLL
jgi:hypothetical protein